MKLERRNIDGRNIDQRVGMLEGEASHVRVEAPGLAWPLPEAERRPPAERAQAQAAARPVATYYDMPALKAPPWTWTIPAYFYAGGAAGGAAALAAAAQLARRPELDSLVRKCRVIAAAGEGLGAALLIGDLGRPARFLNMLRVFRPTSPMNLGTWILSASGLMSALGLVGELRRRPNLRLGLLSGLTGVSLATYTAVLLSNTAVPLWSESAKRLPPLFAASAAASTAALLDLTGAASPAESRVVRSFGGIAKVTELVAMRSLERSLAPRTRAPLRRGRSGALWRAAMGLGAAGLVATLWPGGGWKRRVLAGALGTASALAMRFAVVEAGKRSARDPRATFEAQRR